jgi:GNAT superfamily N-acetyltransferase
LTRAPRAPAPPGAVSSLPSPVRVVSVAVEDLERVRDLWEQMRLAYLEIVPDQPIRGGRESWARRRTSYERHLRAGTAFVLGLEGEDDRMLAYAAVVSVEPSAVFAASDRVAKLETIVVSAERRGEGLGAQLIDAVRERVRALGHGELVIEVLGANRRAAELYGRLGFNHWTVTLREVFASAAGSDSPPRHGISARRATGKRDGSLD